MDYNYNNSKYILFLLFLSPQLILTDQSDFIKSTKLPNNNFFIIKSDGLYNYNQDLSANNIIYSFPLNNQINSADDKINTIISEIEHENNLYLISLAKKNIYIYDYMNNNIYDSPYYLNELNTNSNYIQTGVNYKLIPYKFNSNNLEFIIVLMMVGGIKGNSILFLYYEIDINNKKVKFVTEKEFKDHSLNLGIIKGSNLSPYNISCHIFCHIPIFVARKQSVHIQIKGWNSSCDGINSQRIHRRININDSSKVILLFINPSYHLIAHILSLKFISMNSCYYTDTLWFFYMVIRQYSSFLNP